MSENINEQIECCDCNEIHEDLLKIVNDTMPEETELYDLAELFKVFGDSTRIRILFVSVSYTHLTLPTKLEV